MNIHTKISIRGALTKANPNRKYLTVSEMKFCIGIFFGYEHISNTLTRFYKNRIKPIHLSRS